MLIKKIDIGLTEESKREAIQKYLGRQVILNDDHNSWSHGRLLEKGYDTEFYQIQMGDARQKRQLHYHELTDLFVLAKSPQSTLPPLDKSN